jgi:hypothetical protein
MHRSVSWSDQEDEVIIVDTKRPIAKTPPLEVKKEEGEMILKKDKDDSMLSALKSIQRRSSV